MSLDGFIPQFWSANLLENLRDAHVYASLMSREYEGEIKGPGDSVRIQSVGRPTIAAYTKNSTTITPENLTGAAQVLVVDQANYFAFEIDDIDKTQQKPKLMDEFAREAAWALSETADTDLADELWAGIATANVLTAASSVGTGAADDDAYEILVNLAVKLSENNVRGDRWCVVPDWFHGMLQKDSRFVSFGTSPNLDVLKNGGPITSVSGMKVHVSHNVPINGSAYRIIAGYKGSAAYAEQIMKTEAFRPQSSFSDALKGLHVYGRKVLRPTTLAGIEVTQAA
jgi:hypothetical protein